MIEFVLCPKCGSKNHYLASEPAWDESVINPEEDSVVCWHCDSVFLNGTVIGTLSEGTPYICEGKQNE